MAGYVIVNMDREGGLLWNTTNIHRWLMSLGNLKTEINSGHLIRQSIGQSGSQPSKTISYKCRFIHIVFQ